MEPPCRLADVTLASDDDDDDDDNDNDDDDNNNGKKEIEDHGDRHYL